jgi:hypothetical protein
MQKFTAEAQGALNMLLKQLMACSYGRLAEPLRQCTLPQQLLFQLMPGHMWYTQSV